MYNSNTSTSHENNSDKNTFDSSTEKAQHFVDNYQTQLEKEQQTIKEKLSTPPVEITPYVIKTTCWGAVVGLCTGTLFGFSDAHSYELRPSLAKKHIIYTIGRHIGLATTSFATYRLVEKLQHKYMKRYNKPSINEKTSRRGYIAGGAAGLVWSVASNNRDLRFMLSCSFVCGAVLGSIHDNLALMKKLM